MTIAKNPDDVSIDAPRLSAFHPDRIVECEDALAGAVTKIIDEAESVGWTIAEITVALSQLSDAIMLQEVDLEEINFYLKDLMTSKRSR